MSMLLVSTVNVGAGGVATIDFTSIPQTGTDLMLVVSHRNAGSATQDSLILRINGSSASTYYSKKIEGNGATVLGGGQGPIPNDQYPYSNSQSSTTSTFTTTQYYFPLYSLTGTKNWTIDTMFENQGTGYQQIINSHYATSVSGITSISLNTGYTISQYSTASLYTITKGSGGAITTP
jgi:hypothetical protein